MINSEISFPHQIYDRGISAFLTLGEIATAAPTCKGFSYRAQYPNVVAYVCLQRAKINPLSVSDLPFRDPQLTNRHLIYLTGNDQLQFRNHVTGNIDFSLPILYSAHSHLKKLLMYKKKVSGWLVVNKSTGERREFDLPFVENGSVAGGDKWAVREYNQTKIHLYRCNHNEELELEKVLTLKADVVWDFLINEDFLVERDTEKLIVHPLRNGEEPFSLNYKGFWLNITSKTVYLLDKKTVRAFLIKEENGIKKIEREPIEFQFPVFFPGQGFAMNSHFDENYLSFTFSENAQYYHIVLSPTLKEIFRTQSKWVPRHGPHFIVFKTDESFYSVLHLPSGVQERVDVSLKHLDFAETDQMQCMVFEGKNGMQMGLVEKTVPRLPEKRYAIRIVRKTIQSNTTVPIIPTIQEVTLPIIQEGRSIPMRELSSRRISCLQCIGNLLRRIWRSFQQCICRRRP